MNRRQAGRKGAAAKSPCSVCGVPMRACNRKRHNEARHYVRDSDGRIVRVVIDKREDDE